METKSGEMTPDITGSATVPQREIFSLKKTVHLDQGGRYPGQCHLLSVPSNGVISVVMHIHSISGFLLTIDLSVRRRMAIGVPH